MAALVEIKNNESKEIVMLEVLSDQRKIIVEKIIADMQESEFNFVKCWDNTFAPRNPVSGTVYRGGNRLILGAMARLKGFEDPRWVTFKQAKKAGWKVAKDAKSVMIEKWKEVKMPLRDQDDVADEEKEYCIFLKCVGYWRVFNAEDIEGIPEMEQQERYVETDLDVVADRLKASSRCMVNECMTDTACYIPLSDTIEMPLRKTFHNVEFFIRVLVHEMGHSTGHKSCLDRSLISSKGEDDYAFEELIAELTAVFSSTELGIILEHDCKKSPFYEHHLAYLKAWIKRLKNDPDELFKAAAAAEKASRYIVDRYNNAKSFERVA